VLLIVALSLTMSLTAAVDGAGATTLSGRPAAGEVVTLAGDVVPSGPALGVGFTPSAVASSGSSVIVADAANCVVRSVASSDAETLLAGNASCGYSGDGGPATKAQLKLGRNAAGGHENIPSGVTVDSHANLAIADSGNARVRFVPAVSGTYFGRTMNAGDIYTVAGDGTYGHSGDGGPATKAELKYPSGVAVDSHGNLAIADSADNTVRFVPNVSGTYFGKAMTAGDIYTVAGDGKAGYSGDNGQATSAELAGPSGVDFSAGAIAIADSKNNVVRFVPNVSGTYFGGARKAGDIYTVVGSGIAAYYGDGYVAWDAELNLPSGIDFDSHGNLAIADTDNCVVRFVPAVSGTYFGRAMGADRIYTVAGKFPCWGYGGDGGPATQANFNYPLGVAFDNGSVAVADTSNDRVRFVPAVSGADFGIRMMAADIYTVAGDGTADYSGDGGPAVTAQLNSSHGVAIEPDGNLAVADYLNQVVRFVPAVSGTYFGTAMTAGDIYTVAGLYGGRGLLGDGGPATKAELNYPVGVAFDSHGNIAIADSYNLVVRFVANVSGTYFGTAMTAGDIYTVAGDNQPGYSGDGGPATKAWLNYPSGVAVDSEGNLAIADSQNNRVRFVPAVSGTYFGRAMTAGDIYTVAGDGTAGYSGDGGPASKAELKDPTGVAVDSHGNLVIADASNNRVRFVPDVSGTYFGRATTDGDIYTVAGDGTGGYSGDGGPASKAELNYPPGVAIDSHGNLAVADRLNQRVRFVPAVSGTYFGRAMTGGDIYTVAGNGTGGYSGDGGPATTAELRNPSDVAFDSVGNLSIADPGNQRVRLVYES
jgi:hypothetical protein